MKRIVFKFSHSMDAHTFILDEREVPDDDVPSDDDLFEEAQELALDRIEYWAVVEETDS